MAESIEANVAARAAARPARGSGLLLHPTSLPGPGGVGDLGPAAYGFVDFLADARQTLWQMLPLGPIGHGYSPYAATSAFAGNPLLVALQPLLERGWLDPADLEGAPLGAEERVDYEAAARYKGTALGQAWRNFEQRAEPADRQRFEAFCQAHAWLPDFALFSALKETRQRTPWYAWENGLIERQASALERQRRELAVLMQTHAFSQFLFFEQWSALKRYANERGVRLIGDIPIFVAHDSADVWAHQAMFFLEPNGAASVVAGVPPDAFSATGQRWGNPLYRWDRLAAAGYGWWIERFRGTLETVDLVRLDHFRGFEAYWEVPGRSETAVEGRWVPGPGEALFRAVEQTLGEVPMIVEDLGVITPAVEQLRERLGYPGMKVLQFAFGDDAQGPILGRNPYLPHNYRPNCVVYTGTHDNDTTVGWYASLDEAVRHAVRRYLAVDGGDIAWDLIRCALRSVAELAIIPLQDVLSLGNEARMNLPGTQHGNWSWRYRAEQLGQEAGMRLAELTAVYGRLPESAPPAP
jgi:4-alpha-glucanotransferase